MARLKHTLPGASVLEAIVASILFMVIFCIAIETLTRVGTMKRDDTLLEMETDLQGCVREFTLQVHETGEYSREYDWGEIAVLVAPYRDLDGIRELCFDALPAHTNRKMTYRTLVVYGGRPISE